MRKNFFVSIVSQQSVNEHIETTKIFAPCSYELKNGSAVVSYEEKNDEQKTSSRIAVSGNGRVTISRTGAFSTELTLEEGVHHSCVCKTEFGNLKLGVLAREIKQNIVESGCYIELNYLFDVDKQPLSDNKVVITVKEKKYV